MRRVSGGYVMEQDRTWLLLSLAAFVVRLRLEDAASRGIYTSAAEVLESGNGAGVLGGDYENGTTGERGERIDRKPTFIGMAPEYCALQYGVCAGRG